MITLESFVVLKKLSVKNIRIEPKQVKAEYCIEHFNGNTFGYDFIYSYEYSYFNKKEAKDVNLASMMLAQIAINYGLFFHEIEFDGLFDKTDQRFIIDMTENTSKEVLTNKLLIKNEFLVPPYNTLKAEKRERYTLARITFLNSDFQHLTIPSEDAETDFSKYAILSSGGKDSLLTYGIINEFGTPYPVFVNESGRHWFTAVNAYRYFKTNEPNTEKPWTNSDRVFNWVLKQLPFIKENYANIRADIYPVRLWTVAVFLFGVLPVARIKGIGNIIIGNEYDTTVKVNTNGITHYNGLYDQSKYFDNSLSRYYKKKGWNIHQFSILRSLSELLIMKMLVKRYPKIQQHQVSCHAAHKVEERMYPCGKCEKCRRIIGMLKALDEDPKRCGYNDAQIEHGLKSLEKVSVKQIGSDANHLFYLLVNKGIIDRNEFTKVLAKEREEIMQLRFDKERSNMEDLPKYVRTPVYKLLEKEANKSVLKKDNKWTPIQLDKTFLESKDYIIKS